jgi:hypothetical protein
MLSCDRDLVMNAAPCFGLPQALDYKMQRAYNWKVKSTGPNEALSLYFLSFRDGQCVYNELPHTLHLRRRQKVCTSNGPIRINARGKPWATFCGSFCTESPPAFSACGTLVHFVWVTVHIATV